VTPRKAELRDSEAIRDLINTAFRVEAFFVDGDRISLGEVHSRFETGEFIVSDAVKRGGIAGVVYIEPRVPRAYLGLLSVHPAHQNLGLGKILVAAAERRCRELGCTYMDLLIVNLRDELPPFYSRLGYSQAGTEAFPADVQTKLPCHFIRMSKPL
jgi:GNAT superfamily N-acetyltransferase